MTVPVMMQAEYLFIVDGSINLYNHYGNHRGVSSGNQELIYIKIQLFILWHIPKEPYILPKRNLLIHVRFCFIYNRQKLEAAQISTKSPNNNGDNNLPCHLMPPSKMCCAWNELNHVQSLVKETT